jgi:hypothetical protein
MVMWSVIFVLISSVLLLGFFYKFPIEFYMSYPVATLLAALGLLYRTLHKIRSGEKEKYRIEINRLRNELDEYKKKIVRGEPDTRETKKPKK